MAFILALDFGGTKHSAAVWHSQNERTWLAHVRQAAPRPAHAEADWRTMLALARQVLNGATPQAVGVSFGGPVDGLTGVVALSHHVPGWEHFPLCDRLRAEFGVPVMVDNDANAGALGEWVWGAGRGTASLLYVTVSTGVGGGWVLHGQVWRGHNRMAGEFGHMTIDPNGPLCLCGKRGCIERLASGPYLAEDARAQLLPADPLYPQRATLTARDLAAAAAHGHPLAQRLIERAGTAIGVGLGNAANLINPQMCVLGGGLTHAGDVFWRAVHQAARATALPEVTLNVVPAQLGDDAPLWGAVSLAWPLAAGLSVARNIADNESLPF